MLLQTTMLEGLRIYRALRRKAALHARIGDDPTGRWDVTRHATRRRYECAHVCDDQLPVLVAVHDRSDASGTEQVDAPFARLRHGHARRIAHETHDHNGEACMGPLLRVADRTQRVVLCMSVAGVGHPSSDGLVAAKEACKMDALHVVGVDVGYKATDARVDGHHTTDDMALRRLPIRNLAMRTRFGRRTLSKSIETTLPDTCGSVFPKSSFGMHKIMVPKPAVGN